MDLLNNRDLQKLLTHLEHLHEKQKKVVVAELDKLKEIESDYAKIQQKLEERIKK